MATGVARLSRQHEDAALVSAFKSLATRLREGHVKDRRYKLRNYPRCFTGRRALQLTRVHMPKAHAVALLRRFVECDWIINVVDNSVRFSASRSALYSFTSRGQDVLDKGMTLVMDGTLSLGYPPPAVVGADEAGAGLRQVMSQRRGRSISVNLNPLMLAKPEPPVQLSPTTILSDSDDDLDCSVTFTSVHSSGSRSSEGRRRLRSGDEEDYVSQESDDGAPELGQLAAEVANCQTHTFAFFAQATPTLSAGDLSRLDATLIHLKHASDCLALHCVSGDECLLDAVFSGESLVQWLCPRLCGNSKSVALNVATVMHAFGYWVQPLAISDTIAAFRPQAAFSTTALYRFSADEQPYVLNAWRKTHPQDLIGLTKHAPHVSGDIAGILLQALQQCFVSRERAVDVRSQPTFASFAKAVLRLQCVRFEDIPTNDQRKAFFINVYHMLFLHAQITFAPITRAAIDRAAHKIAYCIGGHIYSLSTIHKVMLRANSPYSGTLLHEADPRLENTLTSLDPRIHFALRGDEAEHVSVLHPDTLNDALDQVTRTALWQHVGRAPHDFPRIMLTFWHDFGSDGHTLTQWALSFFSKHRSVTMPRSRDQDVVVDEVTLSDDDVARVRASFTAAAVSRPRLGTASGDGSGTARALLADTLDDGYMWDDPDPLALVTARMQSCTPPSATSSALVSSSEALRIASHAALSMSSDTVSYSTGSHLAQPLADVPIASPSTPTGEDAMDATAGAAREHASSPLLSCDSEGGDSTTSPVSSRNVRQRVPSPIGGSPLTRRRRHMTASTSPSSPPASAVPAGQGSASPRLSTARDSPHISRRARVSTAKEPGSSTLDMERLVREHTEVSRALQALRAEHSHLKSQRDIRRSQLFLLQGRVTKKAAEVARLQGEEERWKLTYEAEAAALADAANLAQLYKKASLQYVDIVQSSRNALLEMANLADFELARVDGKLVTMSTPSDSSGGSSIIGKAEGGRVGMAGYTVSGAKAKRTRATAGGGSVFGADPASMPVVGEPVAPGSLSRRSVGARLSTSASGGAAGGDGGLGTGAGPSRLARSVSDRAIHVSEGFGGGPAFGGNSHVGMGVGGDADGGLEGRLGEPVFGAVGGGDGGGGGGGGGGGSGNSGHSRDTGDVVKVVGSRRQVHDYWMKWLSRHTEALVTDVDATPAPGGSPKGAESLSIAVATPGPSSPDGRDVCLLPSLDASQPMPPWMHQALQGYDAWLKGHLDALLSGEERALFVCQELSTTEVSYYTDMEVLVRRFLDPLLRSASAGGGKGGKANWISREHVNQLFGNLRMLCGVNKELLQELRPEEAKPVAERDIGAVFVRFAKRLEVYCVYAGQRLAQERRLKALLQSRRFIAWLKQRKDILRSADLLSWLAQPVDRLRQYVVQLQHCRAAYSEMRCGEQVASLTRALVLLTDLVQRAGKVYDRVVSFEALATIERNLAWGGQRVALQVPGRRLVGQCALPYCVRGTDFHVRGSSWTVVHVIVLTDVILLCHGKRSSHWYILDAMSVDDCIMRDLLPDGRPVVSDVPADASPRRSSKFQLFEVEHSNVNAPSTRLVFRADSFEDKCYWMSVLAQVIQD